MTLTRTDSPNGKFHDYALDGAEAKGVTTLIGAGVPKPNLVGWSARMAGECAAADLAILQAMEPEAIVAHVSGAANRSRDAAASRGTIVHALAETLLAGGDVEVPDELVDYADPFLRWVEEWEVEPIASEAVIANRKWWYAGTLDLIVRLRGGTVAVVDIKTGQSGIWPDACLQVAAYRHAEVMLDADGREVPFPATDAGYGLWLPGDGSYELNPLRSDDDVFAVFLHACFVAKWQWDTKRKRDYVGFALEAGEVDAS